jgi:cell division septal protein FtsQ
MSLAISISLRAERLPAGVVVRAAVIAAAVVALGVACIVVTRSPLFAVRTIEVSGASRLSEARIVARAHIAEDANALWLDESAVERKLERHVWIADARVSVDLPSTVRIDVEEHVPVAVASGRLGDLYLAANGTSLGRADARAGLPTVDGAGSVADRRAAAAVLIAMPTAVRTEVAGVGVLDDGSIDIAVRGGLSVEYGSADRLAAKTVVLERILEWADASGERVVRFDLVAPSAPAVELA